MFKNVSIFLLVALSLQGNTLGNIIKVDQKSSTWKEHAMDFLKLVELDKVIDVVFAYLNDPEVFRFITFALSDDFKNIVWDFENMDEFKEAFIFLADKGYEVESAVNFINNALELPSFKPKFIKNADQITRGTGMKGLIEDLMTVLPINDFKKLFEHKLETSPEVEELFNTINSEEFLDIVKRLTKSPKFNEIKNIFEGYGFDFKYLCNLAKEILGDYYQGVFCEDILE